MSGGTTEIHRDNDYLASGMHDGTNGATTLSDKDADFKSCGVMVGAYIENETAGTNSNVASVSESEITTDDNISWDNGQTYKIYITSAKNTKISSIWTDHSRGWRTDKEDLIDGWRAEDIDIDDHGKKHVFGPGQPERSLWRHQEAPILH